MQRLNLKKYDFVILWQIDWLASFFLCNKLKTIVLPMYDASGSLSSQHWEAMHNALFISFSLQLHQNIILSGGKSCYIKYFPELNLNPSFSKEDKVKVFFWERRPNTNINFDKIANLLNNKWDSMHVHLSPDPNLKSSIIKNQSQYNITTSSWFETSKEYKEILEKHNVYIAPRYAEGIGMGFLEAMARGQLVIAHDAPTHNEYITNFRNGILFNAQGNDSINLSIELVHELQKNIYIDAQNFRDSWINYYIHILIDSIFEYLNSNISFEKSNLYTEEEKLVLLKSLLYAHNDMEKYFFHIKLFNVGFIYNERESFSKQALKYELQNNRKILIESLNIFIEKYGEHSPFMIFKNLFLERASKEIPPLLDD